MNTVSSRIEEINNVNNTLENKKKELCDSTSTIKQEMSNAFQEIRLKLQKKEKEIMEKTDIFLQEHVQELNTYSRILQSKIISLNKILDTINSNIMRKDEVNLLNFYSDSYSKITHTTEAEIPEIPDLNAIYNMKIAINPTSFETMISNLNGLFLEITSMKGYEINKLNNSYKYSIRRDMYGSTPLNTNGSANNNNINVNNSFSSLNNINANVNNNQSRNNSNFRNIGNSNSGRTMKMNTGSVNNDYGKGNIVNNFFIFYFFLYFISHFFRIILLSL